MARMTMVNLLNRARFCSVRNGIASLRRWASSASVAQEEKQEVQHEKEAYDNLRSALTNGDGLSGQTLRLCGR